MARMVLNRTEIKVGSQLFDLLIKPIAVKRLFLNSIIMVRWVGNPPQTLEISLRQPKEEETTITTETLSLC